jgi:predicted lipase
MIEDFMTSISETLQEQVTLTEENHPEFPLFKVDTKNRINKILTEKEADELTGTKNSISRQLSILRTKLGMTLFPKQFKKRLLESANQVYKPTKKEKSVW